MTTIRRRAASLPRYYVHTAWDQEGDRHMYCVVDRKTRTWARGAKPEGYENEQDAHDFCAGLIAKEEGAR